jgi:HEPN domain-containing protein
MAFLNYASQYHEAAELVFAGKPDLIPVIYFLYFHTVESLLKAYLKAHGIEPPKTHEIGEFYLEARQLGLKIDRDKSGSLDLHNVVALLQAGNEDEAFRYSTLDTRSKPDMEWTRKVVSELMSAVKPVVESKSDKSKAGVPVKFDLTFRVG